jgi:hypothetical protein
VQHQEGESPGRHIELAAIAPPGRPSARETREVWRAAKNGRVPSSHGSCRFIPTRVLLHFADDDAPPTNVRAQTP